KMYPAVGWVRANHVASEDILSDINNLRKENSELKNTVNELSSQQTYAVENIADIDSEFTVNGTYYAKRQGYSQS
ncbi:hypothetical protein, partial [Vibrio parahaemolyticus]